MLAYAENLLRARAAERAAVKALVEHLSEHGC
jgi:hypothetical protein